MPWFSIYLTTFGIIMLYMTLLWLESVRQKNASIVDAFWGAGFVLAGWAYFAQTPEGFLPRKWLLMALVTVWGLRLSFYIFRRNHGKPEDFRYQEFRRRYGPERYWWISFFQVFLLQGGLLWIISAPLLSAQISPEPAALGLLDGLGAVVWAVGLFFEAVGDWQLAQFKANPANKGQVMNQGLWRYTRHPNYFGDACVWWGLWLIALGAGGWWTFFGPLLMTFFLVRVSGAALLEKTMSQRPGYAEYIARTSAFFPWPPKGGKAVDR